MPGFTAARVSFEQRTSRTMLAILLVASVIVVMNETTMTVALPSLMEDLRIDAASGQWLTTSYMLTMAALIPASGFVLQRMSTRAVFGASLAVFCVGTALAAMSPTFGMLLVARVVQAAGASLMGPLLMSAVLKLTPAGRRGQMLGTVTISMAVAPVIGPVLSGFVLQFFSWRGIFVVVLVPALVVLAIGLIKLVDLSERGDSKLDVLSLALTLPSFGLLVFGLSELGHPDSGGVPVFAIASLLVGFAFLGWFCVRQVHLLRTENPLLDLRVLRFVPYRSSIAVLLLAMAVNFGVLIIVPLYLQRVRGLDPLDTGLVLLCGGVLSGVMGRVSGLLFDRHRSRGLTVIGTAVLTSSLVLFAMFGDTAPVWLLAVLYAVLQGGGMGMIATPALSNATAPLPPDLNAHGIAFVSTFQQVAGAAGAAFLVAVLTLFSGGSQAPSAEAAGIQAAFWAAAIIGAAAFVLALFIKDAAASGPSRGDDERRFAPSVRVAGRGRRIRQIGENSG